MRWGGVIESGVSYDPIRVARIAFLCKDGIRIELIEPCGKESPVYPLLKHYANIPYHLCFSVHNMNDSIVMLRKLGFMPFKEPEQAPCMDNAEVIFLVNPYIGMIELCEHKR